MDFEIKKMKNVYGLCDSKNGIQNYVFHSSKNNKNNINIVYGINMSGKSSIIKAMRNLKENEKVENLYINDKQPEIILRFDDTEVKYENKKWISNDLVKDSIFVYDKSFLSKNIKLLGEFAYMGLSAAPYFEAEEKRKEIIVSCSEIKSTAIEVSKVSKIGDFKIDRLGFSDLYKKTGCFEKLLRFYEMHIEEIDKNRINLNEKLLNENLYFFKIDYFDCEKVDKQIESIKRAISDELKKYNIKTSNDIQFYEQAIEYLKDENSQTCPICLTQLSNNKKKEIIKNIIESIGSVAKNTNLSEIIKFCDSIKEHTGTFIHDLLTALKSIIEGSISINIEKDWARLKEYYNYIVNNLETYAFHKVIEKYITNLELFILLNKQIEEIYENNSNVTDSLLVNKFNQLKEESMFPNIRDIEAVLDRNTKFIKINLKNARSELSIGDYHTINASEGEKSLLSILYFFAYVETSKADKKFMFIDDPVDSNDNYNKHLINNFLWSKFDQENTLAIVFSHSIDVMRYYVLNKTSNCDIHMINIEYSKLIFRMKNSTDIAIFKGLSFFFKEAINKSKNIVFTSIALLPLLREFLDESLKFDYSIIERHQIQMIYKMICERAMHFNPLIKPMRVNEIIELYDYVLNDRFKKSASNFKGYDDLVSLDVFDYIEERASTRKYSESNVIENLMFKNLLALYLRYLMEKTLYEFIIEKNSDKENTEVIKQQFAKCFTLNSKFLLAKKYKNCDLHLWEKIETFFHMNRITANEFQHLVNTYITPTLELKLGTIKNCITKIEEIRSQIHEK